MLISLNTQYIYFYKYFVVVIIRSTTMYTTAVQIRLSVICHCLWSLSDRRCVVNIPDTQFQQNYVQCIFLGQFCTPLMIFQREDINIIK